MRAVQFVMWIKRRDWLCLTVPDPVLGVGGGGQISEVTKSGLISAQSLFYTKGIISLHLQQSVFQSILEPPWPLFW